MSETQTHRQPSASLVFWSSTTRLLDVCCDARIVRKRRRCSFPGKRPRHPGHTWALLDLVNEPTTSMHLALLVLPFARFCVPSSQSEVPRSPHGVGRRWPTDLQPGADAMHLGSEARQEHKGCRGIPRSEAATRPYEFASSSAADCLPLALAACSLGTKTRGLSPVVDGTPVHVPGFDSPATVVLARRTHAPRDPDRGVDASPFQGQGSPGCPTPDFSPDAAIAVRWDAEPSRVSVLLLVESAIEPFYYQPRNGMLRCAPLLLLSVPLRHPLEKLLLSFSSAAFCFL
ncbi:hypothetical protein N658DRAFT_284470 [Parathielavia hyrcaniae]|uniref:Uncharacterized protein n=1 Tax=Parathielavia hyrcaniae TaxID=113614 RepID=A0AAN6Q6A8_9PEZI|nr:hypothetical protein N658DRAFT_284470 [Parathielavia hyrcaniae]